MPCSTALATVIVAGRPESPAATVRSCWAPEPEVGADDTVAVEGSSGALEHDAPFQQADDATRDLERPRQVLLDQDHGGALSDHVGERAVDRLHDDGRETE